MKQYTIKVNGIAYEVEVEEQDASTAAPVQSAAPAAAKPAAVKPAEKPAVKKPAAPTAAPAGSETIQSPMPGTIMDVMVAVGDEVREGQVLCVLEAMKMENEIVAPRDGTIAAVSVIKGASVNAGDPLVSLV